MCNVPSRTPSMAAKARAWKNEKYVDERTALVDAGRCHRIYEPGGGAPRGSNLVNSYTLPRQ